MPAPETTSSLHTSKQSRLAVGNSPLGIEQFLVGHTSRELTHPSRALLLPCRAESAPRPLPFPHPPWLPAETLRAGQGQAGAAAELCQGRGAAPQRTPQSPHPAPAEVGTGQQSPGDSFLHTPFHQSARVARRLITAVFPCLQSISAENVPAVIK